MKVFTIYDSTCSEYLSEPDETIAIFSSREAAIDWLVKDGDDPMMEDLHIEEHEVKT